MNRVRLQAEDQQRQKEAALAMKELIKQNERTEQKKVDFAKLAELE